MRGHISRSGLKGIARYGVITLAVLLAWQMVVALMADRAHVSVAVSLAPGSSVALTRAADSELEAKRYDNAADLARRALRAAPFNVRALSVVGRVQSATGDIDGADQTLTLAGNWSLREDPTHAWLTDRRLRQGNYASAFAHAETLVRRRGAAEPQVFELFTVAAAEPAGLSALLRALSTSPPWRNRYMAFLTAKKGMDADLLLSALALNLQNSAAPLSDAELHYLYSRWLAARQLPLVKEVRARLNRPAFIDYLWNGDFEASEGVIPFTWVISTDSGFSVQISDTGDAARGSGLHVDYDGLASGVVARQLLLLEPGGATLSLRQQVSGDLGGASLEWRLICFEGEAIPITWGEPGLADASGWREVSGRISAPATGCTAQWLDLTAVPGDRRRTISAWFDEVRIVPNAGRPAR